MVVEWLMAGSAIRQARACKMDVVLKQSGTTAGTIDNTEPHLSLQPQRQLKQLTKR
jgi:hypothetical protein